MDAQHEVPASPDDWRSRAACQGTDPTWFDYVLDDHESPQARLKRFARARAVCTTCPVIVECVEARTVWDDGIRGGLLWRQGSKTPQPWPLLPEQTSGDSVEPGPPAATPPRHRRAVGAKHQPNTVGSVLCRAREVGQVASSTAADQADLRDVVHALAGLLGCPRDRVGAA